MSYVIAGIIGAVIGIIAAYIVLVYIFRDFGKF
jgi:hypothetical protein